MDRVVGPAVALALRARRRRRRSAVVPCARRVGRVRECRARGAPRHRSRLVRPRAHHVARGCQGLPCQPARRQPAPRPQRQGHRHPAHAPRARRTRDPARRRRIQVGHSTRDRAGPRHPSRQGPARPTRAPSRRLASADGARAGHRPPRPPSQGARSCHAIVPTHPKTARKHGRQARAGPGKGAHAAPQHGPGRRRRAAHASVHSVGKDAALPPRRPIAPA